MQLSGVGVPAGRGVGFDIAHPRCIIGIRAFRVGRYDVVVRNRAAIQPVKHGLGIVAKGQPKVVDQFKATIRIDPGKDRHLCIGGAAFDQRTARVVADPAHDRRPDAGRADHRMRLPPEGRQLLFQIEQGGTGQADDLGAVPDQVDPVHPGGADDNGVAIIGAA